MQRLAHAQDLAMPAYATPGAAGLDLLAANERDIELNVGARVAVPCGISLAVPKGYEAQVRPRSGIALNHGVTVLNSPGTVDSDYRGEVKAILINLGEKPFRIARGMKVAQLVIARHERVSVEEVTELPATSRGDAGFGSTGLSPIKTG
jgi:dUTP pyrophosphatase